MTPRQGMSQQSLHRQATPQHQHQVILNAQAQSYKPTQNSQYMDLQMSQGTPTHVENSQSLQLRLTPQHHPQEKLNAQAQLYTPVRNPQQITLQMPHITPSHGEILLPLHPQPTPNQHATLNSQFYSTPSTPNILAVRSQTPNANIINEWSSTTPSRNTEFHNASMDGRLLVPQMVNGTPQQSMSPQVSMSNQHTNSQMASQNYDTQQNINTVNTQQQTHPPIYTSYPQEIRNDVRSPDTINHGLQQNQIQGIGQQTPVNLSQWRV